jgi:hypothetical protein
MERAREKAEVAACWEANAENWTRFVRSGYDIYRDALNTPAFLAMLPRQVILSARSAVLSRRADDLRRSPQ